MMKFNTLMLVLFVGMALIFGSCKKDKEDDIIEGDKPNSMP